jgi:restriction system protein
MRGSLGAHEQGLIITISDFSKGAKNEAVQADKTPIALMNGEQLVTLLMQYSIGVRSTSYVLFDLEENFLLAREEF